MHISSPSPFLLSFGHPSFSTKPRTNDPRSHLDSQPLLANIAAYPSVNDTTLFMKPGRCCCVFGCSKYFFFSNFCDTLRCFFFRGNASKMRPHKKQNVANRRKNMQQIYYSWISSYHAHAHITIAPFTRPTTYSWHRHSDQCYSSIALKSIYRTSDHRSHEIMPVIMDMQCTTHCNMAYVC